ncbi:MAG: A/G-specific adenine glycosylase [Boseongicola sp.]|nr:A/G-specific adenine glycosylase [Boseongicola sp.]MDD9979702.1 A/G-specific adenine glycosylase [Boseongicola sp.]
MRDVTSADDLLAWYDVHAREMPWRIGPKNRANGVRPDPYKVWLSEIMLQQTTVTAVRPYFERFTSLWPTVVDLANAEDAAVMGEWAGLGYYARARNLLKCARAIVSDHNAFFPDNKATLLTLPGIGPYTASAIAAIAFDQPETVVDGNVERVMSRLFMVETPLPKAKPELTELATALTPTNRPGDYAQAVMDLGATICTPRSPACGICPWLASCKARKAGVAANYPKKLPKVAKPTRKGAVYVARRRDGAWLLETRPDKGLLGGMLGWPGSEWGENICDHKPPIQAEWTKLGADVRHTFTHFHLILDVHITSASESDIPLAGDFVSPANFRPSDLPTVMRKVFNLASKELLSD